jgi:glutamate-1-semialdehyde 2,1-aminomutase
MGTTLAANPLALAALRAALRDVLTPASHARMATLAERLEAGLRAGFAQRALPWHVARVGARTEFGFGPAPRNGTEAEAAMQPELEHVLHLWLLNRGLLVTPFHNMMLTAPAASEADVDALVATIGAGLDELYA